MENKKFETNELRAASLESFVSCINALEHRRNYEVLKIAYERLQSNYLQAKEKWSMRLEQHQLNEQKATEQLLKAHKKIAQLEAQRSTEPLCLTKEKLDIIEMKVTEEMQRKYENEITNAHSCILAVQEETNRLNEEIASLNLKLERQQTDSNVALSQQKLLYEAEIANLRQIKEDLISRLNCASSTELDKTKDDCRQNAQLQAKCLLLMEEVEDLKEKLHAQKQKFISDNEDLVKSATELKVNNRELEADRDNLNKQVFLLKQELDQLRSELNSERQRAVDATQASSEADYKLTQLTQRTRSELANLRLEAQEQRVAIEKQRDQFASKVQDLEHSLEIMQARCQQIESDAKTRVLESAEKEAIARDQLASEKARYEAKLAEMSSRLRKEQSSAVEKKTGLEVEKTCSETLAGKNARSDNSEAFRNELEILKRKLDEAEEHNIQLEKLLQTKIKQQMNSNDPEMNDKNLIVSLRQQLREKEDLEAQLHSARTNLKRYMETASKKKQAFVQRIRKLKETNQFTKLEIERLKTENDILRKNVPQEEYNRVKSLLTDLKRRHEEYQNIILGPPHPFAPRIDPNLAGVNTRMTWFSEHSIQQTQTKSQNIPNSTNVPIERISSGNKRNRGQSDSPRRRTHPEGCS